MRKCLLLVALLIGAQWTGLRAQILFEIPDTVCIRQSVQLVSHVSDASSYYWGFCSGYLQNTPVVTNLGAGFSFDTPSGIEVAKDGNNYYGFVVNRNTNELLRLSYGTSLGNTPTVTNLGNVNNTLPPQPNSIYLTQDAGKWYLFATGGNGVASSTLARFDFSTSLNNTPSSVNLGNPGGVLNGPRGIFVSADAGNYYGYAVNSLNNRLIRLNFGANISLTPTAVDLFNVGNLNGPSDIGAVLDAGNWYLLIPNQVSGTLTRVSLGNSLANGPAGINMGSFGGILFGPSAISVVKDCGTNYAFITNRLSNELVRLDIPSFGGAYTGTNLGALGGTFSSPADISRVIREKDDLFAYVVNATDNSLTAVVFPQCTNSSIASSTLANPPAYSYNTPGYYNIYLAINEGQPNAAVECQQIRVLPIPPITLTTDTLICQGDSVRMIVQSSGAISYTWSPNYNISDTTGNTVWAYPEYSLTYFIHIPYLNGCIVDTVIRVDVNKNKADAGPDRTIFDGASTVLGGPLTSRGPQYTYTWTPAQFIDDPFKATPTVTPTYNLTYYLHVFSAISPQAFCEDIDTVVVHVACNEINLPNAFVPAGHSGVTSRFGLMNRQVVQLNYFRIFDRWGQQVFTTTDPVKQWDGTVNGEPAPFGVYVWEADGFCLSGQRFTRSGNVTLIR